jgi:photosystem II stability/assembly factor-like uncharacterized protein
MGVLALVGTRKGLFLAHGDDGRTLWEVEGPVLDGWDVYHAIVDERDGAIYAAANHVVYGPTVQCSRDGGRTWRRSRQVSLPEDSGLIVNATWRVQPGRPAEPGTLYLGGDPAFLARSDDGGETWEANRGILEHPTRNRWIASRGGFVLHSVQLDPDDAQCMYVALSGGGTFRTDDGGATWSPKNRDVEIDLLGDPYPDVGQCIHKLLLHPPRPERLWAQTHCGVYRSDDRGDSWERLDRNGLPGPFGYTLMLDPSDPDVAAVIPEKGDEYHYTVDGLGVYRTADGGQTWERMLDGLPRAAWAAVLRDASAFDATSMYFGTQSGSLFALAEGSRWVEGVRHLPPILSVEVTPSSG